MRKIKYFIVYLVLYAGFSIHVTAQETLRLSLKNVVDLAINQSSSVKYQQNTYENSFWRWKNFKAQFRPQLVLTGNLPDFYQGIRPNTKSDGSVVFNETHYLRNTASLSVNQIIPQSGTNISLKSMLLRHQDYKHEYTNFQGNPFLLEVRQPIFAYNQHKWRKKTEPLIYTEAQKYFIESIEEISIKATTKFFQYLTVQTNYKLAENNLNNSKDNLKIAETKIKLGIISENDYSRIRLSVLTAQKSLAQAKMDLRNADFELKKYIGLEQNANITLVMPLNIRLFEIDTDKALVEALENRKETTYYKRKLIEADRDLTSAKRNNGLSTTLRGTYGTTAIADNIPTVYDNTVEQKSIRISFAIPILDWGKSSSNVKLAESKRDLAIFDVEQARENFERNVIVQVEKFGLLKEQLDIAKEADNVAGNGYLIALKKFQNGEISITDLNIALSDRDKAKRDYVKSIYTYWYSYYRLRELTLYDFELNIKIAYDNPLLSGLKK